MEKKEEKIFRDIVKILEQDVPQEALAEGNPTPEQEAIALIKQELDKAREEGREELLDSIVVGIEQLKSIVTMFNPMSTEIRAKQSGEIEAYDGLLEKLSKLKDDK